MDITLHYLVPVGPTAAAAYVQGPGSVLHSPIELG